MSVPPECVINIDQILLALPYLSVPSLTDSSVYASAQCIGADRVFAFGSP